MKTKELAKIIKDGWIGVIPTDTIYGLIGLASLKEVVDRIYGIKGRDRKKPFIVLISSLKDLERFKIKLSNQEKDWLSKAWPGKVSVILPCPSKELQHLHRGTKSLAFRLPKNKFLREFIKETGPLVAPSANPEGKPPAENIKEARDYFGDKIDFYFSAGKTLKGQASTLVKIEKNKVIILREGSGKLPRLI